jgi:hypothetical protein
MSVGRLRRRTIILAVRDIPSLSEPSSLESKISCEFIRRGTTDFL